MNILLGIFILLHGLVHMWYVTLSQGWVEFQSNMGWTGKSWMFTNLLGNEVVRLIATIFYGLSTIAFLLAGVGIFARQDWSRLWMIAASIISTITILVFWDGNLSMLVEKGALGLLINIGILVAILLFGCLA
jgi:hypothetical protein